MFGRANSHTEIKMVAFPKQNLCSSPVLHQSHTPFRVPFCGDITCHPALSLLTLSREGSFSTVSVLVSFCQLDTNERYQLRSYLCQTGWWAWLWGVFLINDGYGRVQYTVGSAPLAGEASKQCPTHCDLLSDYDVEVQTK